MACFRVETERVYTRLDNEEVGYCTFVIDDLLTLEESRSLETNVIPDRNSKETAQRDG